PLSGERPGAAPAMTGAARGVPVLALWKWGPDCGRDRAAMSRIACKFGGTSVASAAQIRKVRAIVDEDPRRQVIVVSAPGKRDPKEAKITDLLYLCQDLAEKEQVRDL